MTIAESWPDVEIVQRTVALIPWRSNIALLDKLTDTDIRLWYAKKTIENGFGNPIGVANWQHDIQNSLPENLKASLPTIEDFEKELASDNND